jgi:hypothetical protein
MNVELLIRICGILDLASIAWYLSSRLLHGNLPFYPEIAMSIQTGWAFGGSFAAIIPIITTASVFLYASLVFSGYLLIRLHRIGAVISYVQVPFRILTLIPPSVFFLLWPVGHFSYSTLLPKVVVVFGLLLGSEALKTIIVIRWHSNLCKNNRMQVAKSFRYP